jgi:dienelactone hydrolase
MIGLPALHLLLVLSLTDLVDLTTVARRFLEQCREGQFDTATERFDRRMSEALPAAKLAEVWQGLIQKLGPIRTFGPSRTERVGSYVRIRVRCEFGILPMDALVVFDADGRIAGFFVVAAEGPLEVADPPYADRRKFTEESITVGAEGWPLPGTLSRPVQSGDPRVPLVVLVHGSGPHDRDETIGPNKPFRDLAVGLSSRGIAVLRYDKRTYAHKTRLAGKAAAAITVEEEVVQDALAALGTGRTLLGIDPARVYLLGHSLGGAMAPVIASRDGKLAGVILLAASNRPPEVLIRDQLRYLQSVKSDEAAELARSLEEFEAAFARLDAGAMQDDEKILGASARYWRSWRAVEPAKLVRELENLPFLVLQGGRDYQVTEADFEAFREALQGRRNSECRFYSDLNHLFQKGEKKAVPEEYLKAVPVDERVIDDIATWILAPRR